MDERGTERVLEYARLAMQVPGAPLSDHRHLAHLALAALRPIAPRLHRYGPSSAFNSTLGYPLVWMEGVLDGYSSTRVSLWDSLMFGRLAMGFANVRAGTRVLMLLLVQAIARACYSDAQVFLMDDPLSAVDPEVANHIFQRVFKGLLRGKTRVLVSHALSFAPQADQVVLLEAGRVAANGPSSPFACSSLPTSIYK